MAALLRTRATAIWTVLVLAAALSAVLGTDQGFSGTGQRIASVTVIVVALFKARLVGLYFMGLRDAPRVLRGLLEFYSVAVCALLICLFLLA